MAAGEDEREGQTEGEMAANVPAEKNISDQSHQDTENIYSAYNRLK